MKKINLAIIFGGKSTEHEISVRSARSIINAIDKSKYNLNIIGIDKAGRWFLNDYSKFLLAENKQYAAPIESAETEITIAKRNDFTGAIDIHNNINLESIDVVFPILHGAFGEDGTIQGFLKTLDLAFVGVDLIASAIGMDKDVSKRLLRDAGIPIADYFCLKKGFIEDNIFDQVTEKLGLPLFVKPANAGSSVGVHKINNLLEFNAAIEEAFQYDHKILVEEAIIGREVECAILGNEFPQASVVGEIVASSSFYTYESKYINASDAKLFIPAEMDSNVSDYIRTTAVQAFKILECEGLARVDFFLRKNNTIVLNEINTMPGFTNISMYPKLWEHSGIAYTDLIDKLIQLAIERHQRNKKLKTTL